VENLTGGSQDDKFQFAASGSISGKINGGPGGTNTLDFSERTAPITVNLLAGTSTYTVGVSQIQTTIQNIQNANGGSGADVLIGDGQANNLQGNGGGDVLVGNDGNDTLNGGGDRDLLIGGLGSDTLDGKGRGRPRDRRHHFLRRQRRGPAGHRERVGVHHQLPEPDQ